MSIFNELNSQTSTYNNKYKQYESFIQIFKFFYITNQSIQKNTITQELIKDKITLEEIHEICKIDYKAHVISNQIGINYDKNKLLFNNIEIDGNIIGHMLKFLQIKHVFSDEISEYFIQLMDNIVECDHQLNDNDIQLNPYMIYKFMNDEILNKLELELAAVNLEYPKLENFNLIDMQKTIFYNNNLYYNLQLDQVTGNFNPFPEIQEFVESISLIKHSSYTIDDYINSDILNNDNDNKSESTEAPNSFDGELSKVSENDNKSTKTSDSLNNKPSNEVIKKENDKTEYTKATKISIAIMSLILFFLIIYISRCNSSNNNEDLECQEEHNCINLIV
jgi:hypothetical protein